MAIYLVEKCCFCLFHLIHPCLNHMNAIKLVVVFPSDNVNAITLLVRIM